MTKHLRATRFFAAIGLYPEENSTKWPQLGFPNLYHRSGILFRKFFMSSCYELQWPATLLPNPLTQSHRTNYKQPV